MNQRSRAATESLGFLGLVGLIFVALNVLSPYLGTVGRFDWTANDRYSLSNSSKELVRDLEGTLTITAYFTKDLPPPWNRTEQDVRDLLMEYEAASNGNLEVVFISPESDSESEEAQEAGVQLVEHIAIEDDGRRAVPGFRGLILEYIEKKETIPVIEDGLGLEYEITTKIKQLLFDPPKIGVLGGHDGPSISQGLSMFNRCLETYDLQEVSADGELTVDEYPAVLVVEPHTALSETELQHLNRYVMEGGGLGIFGPNIKFEQPQPQPGMPPQMQMPPSITQNDAGVGSLLRPWGVVVGDGIALDTAAFPGWPARTPDGRQFQTLHPPVPVVFFDDAQAEHPVPFRLNQGTFPFMTTVEMTAEPPEGTELTVLARTGEDSWLGGPDDFEFMGRDGRSWLESQAQAEDRGPQPLMVAIEGRIPSAFPDGEVDAPAETEEGHVLVSGGSLFFQDFWLNNLYRGNCQRGGEVVLAQNAIDWLAQDSDLIAIRAKNVEDPQIEVPETIATSGREEQEAAQEAREAGVIAQVAEQIGDENAASQAAEQRDAARARADEARDEREAAQEAWNATKRNYRIGNMFGGSVLFALFGIFWYFRRRNAHASIKL